MIVRQLEPDEIEKILPLCDEFSNSSGFVAYKKDVFVNSWTQFILSGLGVIFILPEYKGMLGALKFNDPNTGELIATELFWFVDASARGRGIKLLNAFEKWAKKEGCKKTIMVHLSDSIPEEVKKIYIRKGYIELETHYMKGVE